jgi:aminoglycoside 3-N-acetyltransferase
MALVTVEQLVEDLGALGIARGSVVLAHTSLSRLGRVVGGEQAVIAALLQAIGPAGTLVMPSQSWQLCDPEYLNDPDVPPDVWPLVRDHLPAYDRAVTPTRTMGGVAELFRSLPGAVRSGHPHRSFAALGPHAAEIVAVHDLDCPNGERSPLKAMYDLDAWTLLLGVGHDKSTIMHLAEHRSGTLTRTVRNGAPLLVGGRRRWVGFDETLVEDDDFDDVGAAFARETGLERTGRVGDATARLVPQRALVDFASEWFTAHRPISGTGQTG